MATYQPIFPNDKWPARYTFSPAVRVGNLIFLSGTTGTDDAGNIVGPGDIVAQTRRIFEKFELILKSAGASLANIVETTDYFLSLEDYNKTAALRRELFKGPPWPAATGVVVSGLIREGALIEIKGIAAV
ncbi:RidA family protein [Bradyrhizobium sp. NP1]|jgi:enamine deaminase RidA (YjgF/YER057c/UK114 family)|uniref:RidA family protein n=1 Tax=Bradyrhizobium sp. NP1 TaxID=3049772 RepID=UPI0025A68E0A|nr:RidA family protein [Bradyrhizobium sp. NP1]WJR80208.1 RidA family protein [Bradyrhizobium sp. NP1]